MTYIPTRKDDEFFLTVLRLRAKYQAKQIAVAYGLKSERIRVITQRVIKDDLKYSGEDPAIVSQAYSWHIV